MEVTLQVGIHDLAAMLDFPKLDNFITYPRSIDQGTGHLVVYQIFNLPPLRLLGNNENFYDDWNAYVTENGAEADLINLAALKARVLPLAY